MDSEKKFTQSCKVSIKRNVYNKHDTSCLWKIGRGVTEHFRKV